MRFRVTYDVTVDLNAWGHEYSAGSDEAVEQVVHDLASWTAGMFEEPKWQGLTVPPTYQGVRVEGLG